MSRGSTRLWDPASKWCCRSVWKPTRGTSTACSSVQAFVTELQLPCICRDQALRCVDLLQETWRELWTCCCLCAADWRGSTELWLLWRRPSWHRRTHQRRGWDGKLVSVRFLWVCLLIWLWLYTHPNDNIDFLQVICGFSSKPFCVNMWFGLLWSSNE